MLKNSTKLATSTSLKGFIVPWPWLSERNKIIFFDRNYFRIKNSFSPRTTSWSRSLITIKDLKFWQTRTTAKNSRFIFQENSWPKEIWLGNNLREKKLTEAAPARNFAKATVFWLMDQRENYFQQELFGLVFRKKESGVGGGGERGKEEKKGSKFKKYSKQFKFQDSINAWVSSQGTSQQLVMICKTFFLFLSIAQPDSKLLRQT